MKLIKSNAIINKIILVLVFLLGICVVFGAEPNVEPHVSKVGNNDNGINNNGRSIDGVCGDEINSCLGGILSNNPDSETHHIWSCAGTYGGKSVGCVSPKSDRNYRESVDGDCGMINECVAGTFANVPDSKTHHIWICYGSGSFKGNDLGCVSPKSDRESIFVNGVCGDEINSCVTGAFSNLFDTKTHHIWACSGSNGGKTVGCVSPKSDRNYRESESVDGVCDDTSPNRCENGTLRYKANGTHTLWYCDGINGGTNDNCSVVRPQPTTNPQPECSSINDESACESDDRCISEYTEGDEVRFVRCAERSSMDGVCGGDVDSCTSGTYQSLLDNSTHNKWRCGGINGGTNVECSVACSESYCGTDGNIWSGCGIMQENCVGRGCNPTTDVCNPTNTPTPINGDCGGSAGSCTSGTLQDRTNNDTHFLWNCLGEYGGTNDECNVVKPPQTQNSTQGCSGLTEDECVNNELCEPLYTEPEGIIEWVLEVIGYRENFDRCMNQRIPVRVNGVCGESANNCTSGNRLNDYNTLNHSKWKCEGINGGTTEECSVPCGEPFCGTDGDIWREGCGMLNNCGGRGCNPTTDVCNPTNTPTPMNGVCGESANNCSSGNYLNLHNTLNHSKWKCEGINGGTDKECSVACGEPYCADGNIWRKGCGMLNNCGGRGCDRTTKACNPPPSTTTRPPPPPTCTPRCSGGCDYQSDGCSGTIYCGPCDATGSVIA